MSTAHSASRPRPAQPTPTGLIAWHCPACEGRWTAEEVTELRPLGSRQALVQCPRCKDRCRPARASRRAAGPSIPTRMEAIADGFVRPFDGTGLFMIAVLGAVQFIPFIGGLIYLGIGYPYFQSVLRHASRGRPGMPVTDDFSDFFEDIVMPTVRIIGASWVVMLPVFFYIGNVNSFSLSSPVFLALVAFGLAYLPGAILVVALSQSLLRVMNPLVAFKLLTIIGVDYLLMLAAGAGFVFFLAVLVPLVTGPISGWVAPWVGAYAAICTMTIFGNVARRHARSLGIEVG